MPDARTVASPRAHGKEATPVPRAAVAPWPPVRRRRAQVPISSTADSHFREPAPIVRAIPRRRSVPRAFAVHSLRAASTFPGRVADRRCTRSTPYHLALVPRPGRRRRSRRLRRHGRPDRRLRATRRPTDRRRQRFHRRKPGDPRRAARARLRRGLRPHFRPRDECRQPRASLVATSPQPGSRGGRRDELRKRQSDNRGAGAMRVSTVRLPDALVADSDVPSGPRRAPLPSTTDDDFRIQRRHGRHVVPGTTS